MPELNAGGSSQVAISGGVIKNVLRARGSSQVAVSGGSIDAISTYDNSQVTISDGLLNRNLYAYDNSQVTVSGGLFEGDLLVLVDSAVLTIHGSDFAVDSMPVGYTDLYSIFGGSYKYEPYRQLTGTLLNGEPFDNDFRIGELGRIVLVPEPTTLLLLGLGGLALMRGRKQA